MSDTLTANDLWPLVLKLPRAERVRLARLALVTIATDDPVAAPDSGQFGGEEALAWEGEGWGEFLANS